MLIKSNSNAFTVQGFPKRYKVVLGGLAVCSILLAWAVHRRGNYSLRNYMWAIGGSMYQQFTLIASSCMFCAWVKLHEKNRAGEFTRFPEFMQHVEFAAIACIVLLVSETLRYWLSLIIICFYHSYPVSSTGVWRDWLLVEQSSHSGNSKTLTKKKKRHVDSGKFIFIFLKVASVLVSYAGILCWLKLWDRRDEAGRHQGLLWMSVVPIILINNSLQYLLLQVVSFSVSEIYSSNSTIFGFYL